MRIADLGGEFELIKRLLKSSAASSENLILGNGDDAAVLQFGSSAVAITTDSIVEGRHFSRDYFSAVDVGIRALEGAASDICAVGGVPRYFCIALILPQTTPVEWVEELYQGLCTSAKRLGGAVIGGDTNSGTDKIVVNVSVLGAISDPKRIVTRAGATPGDSICLSGPLGGSAAGMVALQREVLGHERVKSYHLRPRCRNDVAESIGGFATSMIDVSDGLSSELHHLCTASNCGAVIDRAKLQAKEGVRELAAELKIQLDELVLNGGEEFELLYTVPKNSPIVGFKIGEMVEGNQVQLKLRDKISALPAAGFNHFKL
jgi:thiamine-monophosphate kinase